MKALVLAAVCASLCACGGGGIRPANTADGAAVAMKRQNFKLAKTPDPELESALEGMLAASYEAVLRSRGGDAGFFAYSLTPKGAVYPLSEIEVSCLVQEGGGAAGKKLCEEFFLELGARIDKALAGRR